MLRDLDRRLARLEAREQPVLHKRIVWLEKGDPIPEAEPEEELIPVSWAWGGEERPRATRSRRLGGHLDEQAATCPSRAAAQRAGYPHGQAPAPLAVRLIGSETAWLQFASRLVRQSCSTRRPRSVVLGRPPS